MLYTFFLFLSSYTVREAFKNLKPTKISLIIPTKALTYHKSEHKDKAYANSNCKWKQVVLNIKRKVINYYNKVSRKKRTRINNILAKLL